MHKRVITLILLSLLSLSIIAPLYKMSPVNAAIYFKDGFEDETHNAWDSETGTVDINDEYPYVGQYSANITVTTNAGQANYLTHGESQDVVFFSGWYYPKEISLPSETYPNVPRISIMEIYTEGPGTVSVGLHRDGSSYYWSYRIGESWNVNSDIEIVIDEWYQIEISANVSVSDYLYGRVQVNGDLIADVEWFTAYPRTIIGGRIGSIEYGGVNDPTLVACFDECRFDDFSMVASIPFTTDFEDPSLSEWSQVENLNITNAWSYSGTYSLYNPVSMAEGRARIWLPRSAYYYLSAYVYWELFSDFSEIFFVSNDWDMSLVDLFVVYTEGEYRLLLRCNTEGGGSYVEIVGTTALSLDTTCKIVLQAQIGTAEENATINVWLNEELEITTSVNNYAGDTNLLNCAWVKIHYPEEETKYVDLFSITLEEPPVGELTATVSPTEATINRNTTRTFTVTALGGTSPYTYKWYVDGTEQEGETLTVFDFRTEVLGFYEIWCNVTDSTETEVKSNVAECTVEAGSLEITLSPSTVSIDLGEYENVTANVIGGTPPLQYQWYRNDSAIGTNSTHHEINATEWGVGVWSLYCNVTDHESVENKSNVVTVYISEGILIATISPSGTINSYWGLKTDFSSEVTGGIPPYTYEWYVNDELKATTSTYRLIHVGATTYSVILRVYDSGINSDWSNTATVIAAEPSAALTPTLKTLRVGQTTVFTCTATAGMGTYTFLWYKSADLVRNITTTDYISTCTYTPNASEAEQVYHFEAVVEFDTGFIDPFPISSNENTVYVFGYVRRIPAVVDTLTTSGVSLPLGHLAQKSAFTAHGYYWQFYYDGYISGGFAHGYLRYKFSMDTQLWVQPDNSPLGGEKVLNNIGFTVVPTIYHGWGGGVPFTVYYDNSNEILYVVYSNGSSTAARSLKIITATFNETSIDWDWGTPETIVTYSNPRLPVCPSMIVANNGNPFIVFLLSQGGSGGPLYHRIIAYYNSTNWNLNPTGDPPSWSTPVSPKNLVNVGDKIYMTGISGSIFDGDIAYFDTTTETVTEEWGITYQEMIPNDPELWNLTSFIDNVKIVVNGVVNGTFLEGEYVVLHLDVYNGSQWFTDVVTGVPGWRIYMEGTGSPETKEFTLMHYISEHLQTDSEIRNSQVRFWFTSSPRVATCTLDIAYYQVENSFGYVLETLPVEIFMPDILDSGRTWQTLLVDGYTGAQTDWVKVGTSPYLNGEDDGSYITTTTPNATDSAYTFQNLTKPGGTVNGAYLYIGCTYEVGVGNYIDVYLYNGTAWVYAHQYAIGDPRDWYVNVTAILDTLDKVNNAQLRFVHRDVSTNFTIDYAELIVDYDDVVFPHVWVTSGDAPYLNATDANNVSVTQGPVSIYLYDEDVTIDMPVPNMISYFRMQIPAHSVATTNPEYIYWYEPIDVVFQESPNGYLSVFLVARTMQTLIQNDEAFTNMKVRHDYLGIWEDESAWWNCTLWYMNLTTNINNVFDANALGLRAGFSCQLVFWNDTLGDYQYDWLNQTDGLASSTTLASSFTMDGTPLSFHHYNESMYVTRCNDGTWNILKFLDENSTILQMNYGEDRCFSYTIESTSYDVKFLMPFIRVTIRAQTQDGRRLRDIGVIMNSELVYTPYNNNYDIIGLYSITLDPQFLFFTSDGFTYAFLYYIVEKSPDVKYYTAHFETSATGDMVITLVYAVGITLTPSEVKPTEPEIKYCFPLTFYIIMVLIFLLGIYLYSQRETWKTAIPLIPVILWLILTRPCPPWDIYIAIILTIIGGALLINKIRQK